LYVFSRLIVINSVLHCGFFIGVLRKELRAEKAAATAEKLRVEDLKRLVSDQNNTITSLMKQQKSQTAHTNGYNNSGSRGGGGVKSGGKWCLEDLDLYLLDRKKKGRTYMATCSFPLLSFYLNHDD
jgi:hypothetical protein